MRQSGGTPRTPALVAPEGDAGFDRAAGLRGDPEALAALGAREGARVLALRRGELLAERAGAEQAGAERAGAEQAGAERAGAGEPGAGEPGAPRRLARLRPDDARLGPLRLFLGLEEGEGLWAAESPGVEGCEELRGLMAALPARDAALAATARALLGWHTSHGFCAACGAATAPSQAGWRRDCPACGAQHFPRTDPVVIMLVTRGNRALLGRSPGWPEGMYSCLAGFMEPGETPEAAVRREVAEEAGIAVGRVSYVAAQPWPWPSSLMIGCRAEALSEAITLDPVELEDAVWVSRERMAVIARGADPAIRAPREGAIAGWLLRMWLADAWD